MQTPAYYADTYEEQAQTKVAATGEHDDAAWVAVEHCLFHPQGGGQPANNHFPGQARIEFTAPTPDARLDTPEGREAATEALRAEVAKAIADDLPVTWEKDTEGRRVVRLAHLHSAPCGGTHVRSLGDLADVVLPTLKVKKGRIRVSYSATHRER
ncbi:hypothetical protein ACWD1Z_26535 [Streptomyces sp. NPDC002784]